MASSDDVIASESPLGLFLPRHPPQIRWRRQRRQLPVAVAVGPRVMCVHACAFDAYRVQCSAVLMCPWACGSGNVHGAQRDADDGGAE
jgi:hypothetical protein